MERVASQRSQGLREASQINLLLLQDKSVSGHGHRLLLKANRIGRIWELASAFIRAISELHEKWFQGRNCCSADIIWTPDPNMIPAAL